MANNRKQPSYLDMVNGIVDYWEAPCQAPWIVYVELAKAPAGRAILQLVMPSMMDVARGYFRPKNLRRGRHMRRGRSGRRGGGIPDTSELIAKRLPGYGGLSQRQVSDGVKFLWIVDGVIQRGLWYWLIADVTLTFFYEWVSAINESEYCRLQDRGGAAFEGNEFAMTGGQPEVFGNRTILYENGDVSIPANNGVFSSPWGTVTPILELPNGTYCIVTYAMALCRHLRDGSITAFATVSEVKPFGSLPLGHPTLSIWQGPREIFRSEPIAPKAPGELASYISPTINLDRPG